MYPVLLLCSKLECHGFKEYINVVCTELLIYPLTLSHTWAFRYLLHYVLSYIESKDASIQIAGFAIVFLIVGLIGCGKIFSAFQVFGHLALYLLFPLLQVDI